jgi:signal transduction histidine kinase
MMAETIISIILVVRMRKTLQANPGNAAWMLRWLEYALWGLPALFVLEQAANLGMFGKMMWHGIVLYLIYLMYKMPEFGSMRNIMFAILPLVAISLVEDIFRLPSWRWSDKIAANLKAAYPFAFLWLIAMLIYDSRQRKALVKERELRLKEEEQKKQIAIKADELEILVAERTAEITKQKEELEHALEELKSTQEQLVQREKLASLGELTAGIAHEIQNPLNFVNNFSEINAELLDELLQAMDQGDTLEVTDIAGILKDNQHKIAYHGKRADSIVKSMLQHSRTSTGEKEPTDLNALCDEYLRLAYHGMRAKDKSFNATLKTDFADNLEKVLVVPQDIGRVLLNLLTNAFHAVDEKRKAGTEPDYHPSVWVSTALNDDQLRIEVKDNGTGIPESLMSKVFQPFFTTKPTGEGTGLGLSISYDIVKSQGGNMQVESAEGKGTCFTILLPLDNT